MTTDMPKRIQRQRTTAGLIEMLERLWDQQRLLSEEEIAAILAALKRGQEAERMLAKSLMQGAQSTPPASRRGDDDKTKPRRLDAARP